ncbi:MAG: glycosyltransferase family 2 protein [Chlorobi bacterium]|nr:glycosyltransferase family 2 protein [Chlorobiota bacterium]
MMIHEEGDEIHIPLVSIVILHYNRPDELFYCLDKIRSSECPNCEVIIVDNHSDLDISTRLNDQYPEARLVRLDRNVGVSGWNYGFKIARGEFVFVLDDDSYPLPGAMSRCVQIMRANERCGIVACKIVNESLEYVQSSHLTEGFAIDFVGCGAMIRKQVLDEVGYFSEYIFLYWHETDFSMKVKNAGWEIIYSPETSVVHLQARSNRHWKGGTSVSTRAMRHVNRSTILTLAMHFPLRRIGLRLMRIIIGRLLFGLYRGSFFPVASGIFSALKDLPSLWNQRNILSERLQEEYQYGAVAGGFFYDGELGFKRPSLWRRRERNKKQETG